MAKLFLFILWILRAMFFLKYCHLWVIISIENSCGLIFYDNFHPFVHSLHI